MHKRMSGQLEGWASAALVLSALLAEGCGSPPKPRNLLVITLDTMRADRLPPYGFTGVVTPALDRLAAEGALFEQSFAAAPLTLPSHATLFTGMYPPRLGVRDNTGAPLSADFQTLAEILGKRGLTTGAFIASAVLAPRRGLDQGFGTYSMGTSPGCPGSPRARRPADDVVSEAVTWLVGHDSAPFFVWVHLYDTHRPYRLPDDYARSYADPYAGAIAFEDAQIARLISHLEARDLLDDTLMVVAGDHGESLGEHGEDSHGMFIYQEALRVPLIMRGPGVVPRRVSAPVRLVDVMPTVLDMFGVGTPPMDGLSLTRLLAGAEEGSLREVYAESLYPQRFGWASLRSLRADRYKVIDAPRPELFDLESDPYEQRNLFESKPSVAAGMLTRLRSFDSEWGRTVDAAPDVDRAFAERLASLGYVSGTSGRVASVSDGQTDPKDRIAAFNHLTRLQAEKGMVAHDIRKGCSDGLIARK
jgi:arylsulfatase A-like enzyme